MKKILTMAAVALLAASCSNDKDVITPDLGTANAPVAIKLTQSVEGLTTKAPITNGSQVEGIVVMVDVTSGHEHDWGSFNPVYKNVINETTKALETRANVAGAVFTAGTETDITLTPVWRKGGSGIQGRFCNHDYFGRHYDIVPCVGHFRYLQRNDDDSEPYRCHFTLSPCSQNNEKLR